MTQNKAQQMAVHAQEETRSIVEVDSITTIDEPKRYYVIMHNDDSTPFDFVIEVLVELYRHSEETAADLANKIHIEGKAIVGMFNLEIAEQKVEETVKVSRANNFPLSVSMEVAD